MRKTKTSAKAVPIVSSQNSNNLTSNSQLTAVDNKKEIEKSEQIKYLQWLNSNIMENIKFADEKARFIIGFNAVIIGYLYSLRLPIFNIDWYHPLSLLPLTTFILLLAGTFICMLVIYPRGTKFARNEKHGELVIDSKVIKFDDSEKFLGAIEKATEKKITQNLSSMTYSGSKTSNKKYFYILWGIRLSIISWLTAIVLLIMNPPPIPK